MIVLIIVMAGLEYFEKFSDYMSAVQSIYRELGESFNKHATVISLSRHVEKNQRKFVRDLVRTFVKFGFLRKHRTGTYSWTNKGLEYAKRILFSEELRK